MKTRRMFELFGMCCATALMVILFQSTTGFSPKNATNLEEPVAINSGNPFIGEIIMFGGNFAPRGWAKCEGQLLPISQYSALFSILGTTYGGDGRTTFALPDLRGRVAVGEGNGPGLSDYRLGQKGGIERVTQTIAQMPSHSHTFSATATLQNYKQVTTTFKGQASQYPNAKHVMGVNPQSAQSATVSGTTDKVGGGQAMENRQPYMGTNFIIALEGTYPSRS